MMIEVNQDSFEIRCLVSAEEYFRYESSGYLTLTSSPQNDNNSAEVSNVEDLKWYDSISYAKAEGMTIPSGTSGRDPHGLLTHISKPKLIRILHKAASVNHHGEMQIETWTDSRNMFWIITMKKIADIFASGLDSLCFQYQICDATHLRRSHDRLARVEAFSKGGYFEVNFQTGYAWGNEKALDYLNCEAGYIVQSLQNLEQLIDKGYALQYRKAMHNLQEFDTPVNLFCKLALPNGYHRSCQLKLEVYERSQHGVLYVGGFFEVENDDLLNEYNRLIALVDESPLALLETTLDGALLWGNDAYLKLLGYKFEELAGMGWVRCWKSVPELDAQVESYKTALLDGGVYERKMQIKGGYGKDIIIKYRMSKASLNPTSCYGFMVDVTQEQEMEEQLTKRNQELELALQQCERASRARSNFFTSASHEIRTPLNGILGNACLLKDTGLNEDQQELVKEIVESSGYLAELLGDILELAKIESDIDTRGHGHVVINETRFDLVALFESIVRMFRINLHKDMELSASCVFASDQSQPLQYLFLISDESKLRQIIVNLLSNALKFTDAGKIALKAIVTEVVTETEKKYSLSLTVTDTGLGMDEDLINRVLVDASDNANTSAQMDLSREEQTVGLGLVVCQKIVARLGGQMDVESKYGKGSKVSCQIPVRLCEAQRIITARQSQSDKEQIDNTSVLVVEDNMVNMRLITKMLQKSGYKYDMAYDGESALQLAKSKRYDLVLLDIGLPGISGMEVARSIHVNLPYQLFQRPYIIACTANCMSGDKEAILQSGIDDFIAKPFVKYELDLVLSKYHDKSSLKSLGLENQF
ncbi:hypothetical protein MIR68_007025 [Amoeboaphelidium protococcarum]|nr:hypothetical protein MIR68_007025 [Amoeboaphelidium protococcarum]